MSSGGRARRDTAVQAAAKVRRMAGTACPRCGRKGAILTGRDDLYRYEVCRWKERGLCDYERMTER